MYINILVCVGATALSLNAEAAKGNKEEADLLAIQRQFNELRSKQELNERLTNERIQHLESTVESQMTALNTQNDRIAELETKLHAKSSKRLVMDNPLVESGRVAFSASLNHDLDAVVNHQKIVFNLPHYNDGGFYNVSNGIFTAPAQGVYLFIYFIGNRHAREVDAAMVDNRDKQNEAVAEGNRHAREVDAELVVNGDKQNEAVAEGVGTYHDTQGGNSAIVKLNPGDMVWIDTTLGDHVEGQWLFSSFTGALLYPIY